MGNAIPTPGGGAGIPAPVAPVLTPEQLREVDEARRRWKKVQRAVGVSRFSAWSLAVFAVLGLMMGVFDPTSAVVGLLLTAITVLEFRGGSMMKRADVRGPLLLGWNQVLLLGLIGAYCFYKVFISPPASMVSDPQLQEMLNDPAARQSLQDAGLSPELLKMVDNPAATNTLLYSVAAFGTMLLQGPLVLYYFSRKRVVETYLRSTPAWVVEVQRRAA